MKKLFLSLAFICGLSAAWGQTNDPKTQATLDSIIKSMVLDSVMVTPQAIDTDGWLLLDESIKNELSGAVSNLYNFKYERAERQFRSLKRRYPEHPMAYFMMGLSQWWKIVPTNISTTQYDRAFFAYMDTTITKSEALMAKNRNNYEAAFFLAAAHGFAARLHSERSNWRKATIHSKRALDYVEKAKSANGLSPEFLFGEGLYNYYAPWISEHYPLLRPILLFFPDGNKPLGLNQLREVANYGFYTGPEAKIFLMKILASEENNPFEAYMVSRELAYAYPDNGYLQRFYARMAFVTGSLPEAEKISLDILDKINRKMPGYEAISGRYAAYFLGYINESRKKYDLARQYFNQTIEFARQSNDLKSGYALHSYLHLARISHQQKDVKQAKEYYKIVKDLADKDKGARKEAARYLRKYRKV